MSDPVIVLAGGLGTRLRPAVPNLPKVLAPVAGKPFLWWLIRSLAGQGVARCVLSLGHDAQSVIDYLAAATDIPTGITVEYRVEPRPLGTGGAVRHIAEVLALDGRAVILNGDTYLPQGFRELARADEKRNNVVGVVRVTDAARYGGVQTDASGRVSAFVEKGRRGPGWINAGICRLDLGGFLSRDTTCFSLESAVLSDLSARGVLYAQPLRSSFIDIGVPEDYEKFCAWAAAGLEVS